MAISNYDSHQTGDLNKLYNNQVSNIIKAWGNNYESSSYSNLDNLPLELCLWLIYKWIKIDVLERDDPCRRLSYAIPTGIKVL